MCVSITLKGGMSLGGQNGGHLNQTVVNQPLSYPQETQNAKAYEKVPLADDAAEVGVVGPQLLGNFPEVAPHHLQML